MRILFLGDVVGISGCSKIMNTLKSEIKKRNINFVVVNGENSAEAGVGLTKEICNDFYNCGVNVITTGNHVWDQKEIMSYIDIENRLLRPHNLFEPSPGRGFEIYEMSDNLRIGVLNLMGNVFMKKCEDVFETSKKFLKNYQLKKDYDLLLVDFHGEITSEKNAIGHFFDGKATLVIGTHTHIPTNDARVLKNGTAYQTDAGMCGDYDSVIGTKKQEFVRKFATQDTERKRVPPADGIGTLCGVIIESQDNNFLAKNIQSIRIGGKIGS
jgi:metallophosphoesterase (TIGR00282 family)